MACYFLGSIPFSYIIAKLAKGIDIRTAGEGNVGGRNVWHVVGKKYGVLAGFLDFLKGLGAYGIGYLLDLTPPWIWACGLFVILGHCFPILLKGRGGKGIATLAGFLAGMQPLLVLLAGAVYGIFYFIFKNFHIAITFAMSSLPLSWWLIGKHPLSEAGLVASLMLVLGIKRIIDDPYMKKIQQAAGWES